MISAVAAGLAAYAAITANQIADRSARYEFRPYVTIGLASFDLMPKPDAEKPTNVHGKFTPKLVNVGKVPARDIRIRWLKICDGTRSITTPREWAELQVGPEEARKYLESPMVLFPGEQVGGPMYTPEIRVDRLHKGNKQPDINVVITIKYSDLKKENEYFYKSESVIQYDNKTGKHHIGIISTDADGHLIEKIDKSCEEPQKARGKS